MNKVLKLNSRNRRAGKAKNNGELLKLDLGCGSAKRPGFIGVDSIGFDGVDVVLDLVKEQTTINGSFVKYTPWPWTDNSVEEVHCSHFIEHLTSVERVHFVNELWRILKPGGKCTLIAPHWSSCRAYGDPTHKWPPVSEFWFYYLNRDWRKTQAPHTMKENWELGFNCHFEVTWGYNLHPEVAARNQEYQQNAIQFWKEAAQDVIATLTASK